MIVGSLLLILVAVTLLVLGLAAGSSTLLISSIVTSLLAAVALVVGARHAAGTRRAQSGVPEPLAVDLDDDPGPAAPVEEPVGRRAANRDAAEGPTLEPMAADPMAFGSTAGGRTAGGPAAGGPMEFGLISADPMSADPTAAGSTAAGSTGFLDRDLMAPSAADTEVFHQDAVSSHDAGDPHGPDLSEDPDSAPAERSGTPGLAGLRFSADAGDRSAAAPTEQRDVPPTGEPHADFDRAQSVIGAARAQDADDPAALGRETLDQVAEDDDYAAEDPADEPPVQRIQPDDAVRVARMPTEVVVVDGRPRYHLSDCPHLVGRSTEPLPVAEAVELGFTPCGLCRPVDRLVAKPARR
jgi:clumping factor A